MSSSFVPVRHCVFSLCGTLPWIDTCLAPFLSYMLLGAGDMSVIFVSPSTQQVLKNASFLTPTVPVQKPKPSGIQ